MYHPSLQSIALSVAEIIGIAVLGWVAHPQSWGRGGCRGSGMVPFERALVTSYRPSIVTFPLSLRVSEILPLLYSSTPLFSTPPLVSPKFPHVPLEVGGLDLQATHQAFSRSLLGKSRLLFSLSGEKGA